MKEGDSVGRYRLGRVLGAGGMGTVFVAHDPQLDRDVALKVLTLEDDASLTRVRRRLGREAKALGSLNDPHVVQVYDAGVDGSVLFISMELIEGGDLVEWLDAHERTPQEIIEVFTAAGRGLAAAHAKGVIHRDFKPANVLVGKDGRVRVVDFGLARLLSDVDSEQGSTAETPSPEAIEAALTIPGGVLGTPAYMSPEQHVGLELDARTDQYSFCIALFEAIHGRRPFGGTAKRIAKDKAAYKGTEHRKNPMLQSVIDRGLAPRRRDRFESMHALLTALGQVPPTMGGGGSCWRGWASQPCSSRSASWCSCGRSCRTAVVPAGSIRCGARRGPTQCAARSRRPIILPRRTTQGTSSPSWTTTPSGGSGRSSRAAPTRRRWRACGTHGASWRGTSTATRAGAWLKARCCAPQRNWGSCRLRRVACRRRAGSGRSVSPTGQEVEAPPPDVERRAR